MAQDIQSERILLLGNTHLTWHSPMVMGILNLTPDSFYDGGKFGSEKMILAQTEKMLNEGAFAIDLGAVSSRPGSVLISEEEEIQRLLPIVKSLKKNFQQIVLSIDTFRSNVAEMCLNEGALIINDISGGKWNPDVYSLCAKFNAGYIMMHSKGTFDSMHQKYEYPNGVMETVKMEMEQQISIAKKEGLENIFVDPGFGFSKNLEQNYELLYELDSLTELELPIIVGLSRKSMIWKVLQSDPKNAMNGTTVLNTLSILKGADILRVHDVKEAVEIITLVSQLNKFVL